LAVSRTQGLAYYLWMRLTLVDRRKSKRESAKYWNQSFRIERNLRQRCNCEATA